MSAVHPGFGAEKAFSGGLYEKSCRAGAGANESPAVQAKFLPGSGSKGGIFLDKRAGMY